MMRPDNMLGLRHVALFVSQFDETVAFYQDLLGFQEEWRPDADNIYLTSGPDNLAIHRAAGDKDYTGPQRLDHLGFILKTPEDVDAWHTFMVSHGVTIKAAPKTHRDGARSFYCLDPDGNLIQLIYHPPIVENLA